MTAKDLVQILTLMQLLIEFVKRTYPDLKKVLDMTEEQVKSLPWEELKISPDKVIKIGGTSSDEDE